MDSPRHSAQYCTYRFMENETHKILCLVTIDKRMTGRKNAILEIACFQKGLRFLLEKGIHVLHVGPYRGEVLGDDVIDRVS